MRLSVLISLSLLAIACGQETGRKQRITLNTSGESSVVVLGAENKAEIQKQADDLGITVSGNEVLILSGDASKIQELEFLAGKEFDYIQDEKLNLQPTKDFKADQRALYLAKKDFGVDEFHRIFPDADGRGVTVGVIDDGISPNQKGFIKTTTGERKFLKKGSQSSITTFKINIADNSGEIDETRTGFGSKLDLNENGTQEKISFQYKADEKKICIDLNLNKSYELEECKGSFSQTGDYFLTKNKTGTFIVEVDAKVPSINIFLPETGDDSHGEGVASVLAGHEIGGVKGFDGVAPGATIVDYDLSHATHVAEEKEYTIGTFLKALDWTGSNGAEVVNISYSLFFSSAKVQTFMNKALSKVIKTHNMVVSFSAGNNGPGLGSLNRRGIYPSGSLVAGAYISKELDEHVHGVTGIPEEGRVVYYSSRGPGLGTGPVLISPLSSLTNGTPDGGHMAFNGTSSASPALAGAATLLISAIKQNKLAVDAETVVHALRQSGEQLKNEPFIFQGYGLPKLSKAFEIYKQLIAGEKFISVETKTDVETSDSVSHSGIFIRTSQDKDVVSRRVFMRGKVSALASEDDKTNLLVPVRIQYSNGITGASRLWTSTSENRFFIDIDPAAVLNGKDEAFGEIRIISDLDNSLMAIVPVTVVNDEVLNTKLSRQLTVGSQEGARMHFYVPEGVKGFRVNVETIEGEERYTRVSVFDPNQVRVTQKAIGSDLWINVSKPGYYQIGLAMNGGTARKHKAKISVDLVNVQLRTKIVDASASTIKIYNGGPSLSAKLILTPASVLVDSKIFSSEKIDTGFELTKEMSAGTYSVSMGANVPADLSYEWINCSTKTTLKDGTIKLEEGSSTVPAEGASVLFRCTPFDQGAQFDDFKFTWTMKITTNGTPIERRLDVARRSTADVSFEGLAAGHYTVEIEDPISSDIVKLGNVEVR